VALVITPHDDGRPVSRAKWIVSVDVGQSIDPTAISILRVATRRQVARAYWDLPEHERVLAPEPPREWYDMSDGGHGGIKWPQSMARVDVLHLERLPLKLAYPEQVARIAAIMRRAPIANSGAELVVDQTGVGRPVIDMFRRAGLRPIGVTITAGDKESRVPGVYPEWRVSKLQLVSRLQALLNFGELKIAKGLSEARAFVTELQDFRATISESGYTRFGAREGQHDDLVLSVAIGAWLASNSAQRATQTFTFQI
jgi:hypothetical protein